MKAEINWAVAWAKFPTGRRRVAAGQAALDAAKRGRIKICDTRASSGAAFWKWETKVALSDNSESPLSVMEGRDLVFRTGGNKIVVCCSLLRAPRLRVESLSIVYKTWQVLLEELQSRVGSSMNVNTPFP